MQRSSLTELVLARCTLLRRGRARRILAGLLQAVLRPRAAPVGGPGREQQRGGVPSLALGRHAALASC